MPWESLIVSAIAGPYFLTGIFLELRAAKRRGRSLHHTPDTITSLGCGAMQQALSVPLRIWVFGAYALVHDRFALFTIPLGAVWAWPLAFVLMDVSYYWFHRASHRVSFLWAAHAVHHQSEEYNLTTALRQSALQESFAAPFYWPLAVLGFPTEMLIACVVVTAFYQFWIHTRLIRRMPPWFEWALNTPAQHRVHHAVDPEYIDKNYAGTLAIWDRLFGTYAPEVREPTFGTVEPLARFDVLEANLSGWRKILAHARRARGLEKLWAFVAPPEWSPEGVHEIPEAHGRAKHRRETTKREKNRLVFAIALASALAGVALSHAERTSALETLPLTLWLVASLLALGPATEDRSVPRALEVARWVALPIALVTLLP